MDTFWRALNQSSLSELTCTHLERFPTTAVTGAVAGGGGKDDLECEFDIHHLLYSCTRLCKCYICMI